MRILLVIQVVLSGLSPRTSLTTYISRPSLVCSMLIEQLLSFPVLKPITLTQFPPATDDFGLLVPPLTNPMRRFFIASNTVQKLLKSISVKKALGSTSMHDPLVY